MLTALQVRVQALETYRSWGGASSLDREYFQVPGAVYFFSSRDYPTNIKCVHKLKYHRSSCKHKNLAKTAFVKIRDFPVYLPTLVLVYLNITKVVLKRNC